MPRPDPPGGAPVARPSAAAPDPRQDPAPGWRSARPDDRQAAAVDALRAAEAAAGVTWPTRPDVGNPTAAGGAAGVTWPTRPDVPNPRVADDDEPDPHSVARAIALRQLAMAPRSRAQLEDKLARRGHPEVVAAVLDRLEDVGLVDDDRFAAQLVDSRRRTKGLSGAALRRELRDKGVDAEIATEAIGALDDATERARAEQLVARRLRSLAGLDPKVQARRLAGMLARKGYSPGVAYAVVRDAVNAAPEHARD